MRLAKMLYVESGMLKFAWKGSFGHELVVSSLALACKARIEHREMGLDDFMTLAHITVGKRTVGY